MPAISPSRIHRRAAAIASAMAVGVALASATQAGGFAVAIPSAHLFAGEAAGASIALGTDGTRWITTSAGRIARIGPAGRVAEFGHGLSHGGAAQLVNTGRHGIWFVDEGAGGPTMIGTITNTGMISEHPSEMAQVGSIVAGPDGAVWYDGCRHTACAGGQLLARMDHSGRVRTYPSRFDVGAPAREGVPLSGQLVVADDRQIWFLIRPRGGGDAIGLGRISAAGRLTAILFPRMDRFAVSPDAAAPLLPGPNGGVWFTASEDDGDGTPSTRLGHVTDSGRVTLSPPLPPSSSPAFPARAIQQAPFLIARAPGGNLWLAEPDSGLALITASGRLISQVRTALPGSPDHAPLVAGPDHTLWAPGYAVVADDRPEVQCSVPELRGRLVASRDVSRLGIIDVRTEAAFDGCANPLLIRAPDPGEQRVVVGQSPAPGSLISEHRPIRLRTASVSARDGRCVEPPGAVVDIRTRLAIVARVPGSPGDLATYLGCSPAIGRQITLTTDENDRFGLSELVRRVVAGHFVAFTDAVAFGSPRSDCDLTVVNLLDGHTTVVPAGLEGSGCVRDIAVSSTGAAAWVTRSWPAAGAGQVAYGAPPGSQLHALSVDGTTRTIATSGPLDLSPPAITGQVLRWTDDNARHRVTVG